MIHTLQGEGSRKNKPCCWHVALFLFCDSTIVMCDLRVFITKNGNKRKKLESGHKEGAELKPPVYAAQI